MTSTVYYICYFATTLCYAIGTAFLLRMNNKQRREIRDLEMSLVEARMDAAEERTNAKTATNQWRKLLNGEKLEEDSRKDFVRFVSGAILPDALVDEISRGFYDVMREEVEK